MMPFAFPFTVYGANRSSAGGGGGGASCDFTYCYGGDWVQGKVGNYGMQFDGGASVAAGGNIDINNVADIVACSKSSISFWVKLRAIDTTGTFDECVFSISQAGTSTDLFEVYVKNQSSGTTTFIGTATTSQIDIGADDLKTTQTLEAGEWNHIVITGDSSEAKIYLNGELVDSDTGLTGWWNSLTAPDSVILGGLDWSASIPTFDGEIDEFAIWDVILTPAQVSLLSTGSVRADSITPDGSISGYGDWNTTYKKIGTYGIGLFNGSNDVISLTPSSSMAFAAGDAWSWSGWYYPTNLGATTYNFLFAQGPSGGAMFAHGFNTKIYFGESRNPYGSKGYIQKHTVAGELTLNTWNHVVITCNGNGTSTNSSTRAAAYNCYVNATASSIESTDSNTQLVAGAGQLGDLHMGNRVQGSLGWNGYIDDTAMFNVGLDATAVAQIYESGSADVGAKASNVSSSALVGYWDMENYGPGSTAVSGAFGQHGVMGGTLAGGTSTTGSLLLYYDFEIGDNNPVSGNFYALGHPTSASVYDVVTASFHPSTAHTGTMTNMSVADWGQWGQGKIGKYSIEFTGSMDNNTTGKGWLSASAAANTALGTLTDNFTLAGWYRFANPGGNLYSAMITNRGDVGGATKGWTLTRAGNNPSTTTDNKIALLVQDGTYRYWHEDSESGTEWVHIVCGIESGTPFIYKNGSAQSGQAGQSAPTLDESTDIISFGRLQTTYDAYYASGSMDEVSIWSGSLDNASILNLYSGSKANAITPTVPTSQTGSWTPGKIGDYSIGLNQDGVERVDPCEGISAASASAFPLGATVSSAGDGPAFSVAAWIYPQKLAGTLNVTDANWRVIVGRDGSGTTGYNGWKISMDGASGKDGMISWAPGGYPSSGYNGRARSATGAIEINKWHLVVGVWDPSASGEEVKMYIYKEGVAGQSAFVQTAYSSLSFTPGPGTDALSIGCYDYPEGPNLIFGWMGKIDDVGIWNVALDSGATNSLWNSGTGSAATTVSSSNLVSNWTMDSTYGTTTIVDGVAGNNGTLSNATMPAPTATLKAYWDMECDGPGNNTVKDLSGNGYDLTRKPDPGNSGSCGAG